MGNVLSCHTSKSTTNSYQNNESFQSNQNSSGIIENNKDSYFDEQELKSNQKVITNMEQKQSNNIQWISVNQPLGQGSFGLVVLGMDQLSGQYIAVKQVSIKGYNIASTDYRINSFKLEIELLSKLQHPNIVKYIGMEQTNSHINLFLEYVAGGSILSLLHKYGGFRETLLKVYTRQILQGLEYLHCHGIIHRDIKGANVLVDNNGVCKLADFGSSKRLSEFLQKEECKSLIGTPNWMAPEVIKQVGHGRFADIWSLGCTVIEMATGKPPWSESMQKNQMATLLMIANGNSPPPYPQNLSAIGKDFLDKCFQRDPSKRWNVKKLLNHPFINDGSLKNVSTSDVSAQMNFLLKNHKKDEDLIQLSTCENK